MHKLIYKLIYKRTISIKFIHFSIIKLIKFILGDSIVNHINGYDISRQIENCRVYVKVSLAQKQNA